MKKPIEVGGRHELFSVGAQMRTAWLAIGKKRIPTERPGCLWGCVVTKMPDMLRRECGARKCWRDKARPRGEVEGCGIFLRPTVSFL